MYAGRIAPGALKYAFGLGRKDFQLFGRTVPRTRFNGVVTGHRAIESVEVRWPSGRTTRREDGAPDQLLVMSEEKAAELGLTPKARFVQFALVGVDPVTETSRVASRSPASSSAVTLASRSSHSISQ